MGYQVFAVAALIFSVGYFNIFDQSPESLKGKADHFFIAGMESKNLSAFVLGGTGAVGKAIIEALAAAPQFTKVTLIGRRQVPLPTPDQDPRYDKFDEKIIDFEKLPEYAEAFKGYDVGFSSLGTTRAKSGAEGFVRVDHDYVVGTAKLAKEGGCKHLHLVSSWGANKDAFFLYSKTKGQVEEELGQMDFPRLSIYQPGLLLVEEREDVRMLEAVARCISKPLDYFRWFSVDVPVLGRVIVDNTFRDGSSKVERIAHATIIKLGKEAESATN